MRPRLARAVRRRCLLERTERPSNHSRVARHWREMTMGCCGGKRAALRNQRTTAPAPVQPHVRRVAGRSTTATDHGSPARNVRERIPEAGAVTLRYIATASILVVGPVTGRRYRFSAAELAVGCSSRCAPPFGNRTLHSNWLAGSGFQSRSFAACHTSNRRGEQENKLTQKSSGRGVPDDFAAGRGRPP